MRGIEVPRNNGHCTWRRRSNPRRASLLLAVLAGVIFSTYAQAEIVIDPAAFPDDTDLTHAYPGVTLIGDSFYLPGYVSNATVPVLGAIFVLELEPKGSGAIFDWFDDQAFPEGQYNVFEAHFAAATDSVKVAMLDGGFGSELTGILEAYDEAGNLLATESMVLVVYPPQTVSIQRPSADIRSIRAYGSSSCVVPFCPGPGISALITKLSFQEWAPTLSVSPPSGSYASTQSFDLTLILRALGVSIAGGSAVLDGLDITPALAGCSVRGTLVSGGQTFRCSSLSGSQLGVGTHTLDVSFDLSDGTTVQDAATWEVLENTEP